MFTVVITEKGGEQRRLDFDKPEVTIGRVQGNDIILPKGNVSKRHSRIVLKDGKFIIVDLKSTNGTYVNGRKITSPLVIKSSDKIYIGDFILHVEDGAGNSAQLTSGPAPAATAVPPPEQDKPRPPPPLPKPRKLPSQQVPVLGGDERERVTAPAGRPAPAPLARSTAPGLAMGTMPPRSRQVRDTIGPDLADPPPVLAGPRELDLPRATPPQFAPVADAKPTLPTPPPPELAPPPRSKPAPVPRPAAQPDDSRRARVTELQKDIHDRLLATIDLRRMDIEQLGDEELWDKAESAICDIVQALDDEGGIPAFVNQDDLIKNVLHEALGLGPLEDLLEDEAVETIMVNRPDQIYVERNGHLELTPHVFSGDKAVLGVIERIVAPLGCRIDEGNPVVDTRLKDGSRVNAVVPPLALKGPTLTIRKSRRGAFSGDQLVQMNTLSRAMLEFLQTCVGARKNIVIAGGAGVGRTATLNMLGDLIAEGARVITIEDAAELQLKHEHWIQLESRPPSIDGKGQVTLRDLVRNALRMRPDRIIVGECRGAEALEILQAMNAGHDGSLTAVYAISPRDALARVEAMALMSGGDLPARAVRELVASAVHIVVHQARLADGSRRITTISEVVGVEGEGYKLQDIFVFKQEGSDEQGRVRGRFLATGVVPRFCEDLQRRGVAVNMNNFREA